VKSGVDAVQKMNSTEIHPLPYYETIESAGKDKAWLVMVHGLSQHLGVFSSQVESFRHRYRLLRIDLPGHGRSASIPGPYGLVEYAESVLAVLDHIGIAKMHYWGTHTGAGVGLLLAAADQGKRFKSLILDGAVMPGVDLPSITAALSRAKTTARTSGIEVARREWFDQAAWFDVMRSKPEQCRSREHWLMISEFAGGPWLDTAPPRSVDSIEEGLRALATPTLLINGEHDLADFRMIANRVASLLPNAQQYVVPGGGGFPLWEYPREVNSRVSGFLLRPCGQQPPTVGCCPEREHARRPIG
jgi:pimeloyl-ACP methyl ester carboxylesterase